MNPPNASASKNFARTWRRQRLRIRNPPQRWRNPYRKRILNGSARCRRNVTAYQGFLLDVTERRHAEQEIRRRNRELVVLNSLAETLVSTLDLQDSIHRSLRQILELFTLDAAAVYLFDSDGTTLRRVSSVGQRSEFARNFPAVTVPPELLSQIPCGPRYLSLRPGSSAAPIAKEVQLKEGIESAYLVLLWSKDKIIGGLTVGSRALREFSSADISLLTAVAGQVASAVERTMLYEETRQAYDNLRRTQEQLLHSENSPLSVSSSPAWPTN